MADDITLTPDEFKMVAQRTMQSLPRESTSYEQFRDAVYQAANRELAAKRQSVVPDPNQGKGPLQRMGEAAWAPIYGAGKALAVTLGSEHPNEPTSWENNPITNFYQGVIKPIAQSHIDQAKQAYQSFQNAGGLSALAPMVMGGTPNPGVLEAMGHGLAAVTPMGPIAAQAGEQIGKGNVAGGLTTAGTLAVPAVIKGLKKARSPVERYAPNTGGAPPGEYAPSYPSYEPEPPSPFERYSPNVSSAAEGEYKPSYGPHVDEPPPPSPVERYSPNVSSAAASEYKPSYSPHESEPSPFERYSANVGGAEPGEYKPSYGAHAPDVEEPIVERYSPNTGGAPALNLDLSRFEERPGGGYAGPEVEPPPPPARTAADVGYDAAREKFNMGRDMPTSTATSMEPTAPISDQPLPWRSVVAKVGPGAAEEGATEATKGAAATAPSFDPTNKASVQAWRKTFGDQARQLYEEHGAEQGSRMFFDDLKGVGLSRTEAADLFRKLVGGEEGRLPNVARRRMEAALGKLDPNSAEAATLRQRLGAETGAISPQLLLEIAGALGIGGSIGKPLFRGVQFAAPYVGRAVQSPVGNALLRSAVISALENQGAQQRKP